MSLYTINNDDDSANTPVIDKVMVGHIVDFKNKITSKGSVSRNEILAVEEFIGMNIFTDKLSINMFTSVESHMGLKEVTDIVDNISSNVELDAVLTRDDILIKAFKSVVICESLIRKFKYIVLEFNTELYESIINPKIINRYQDGKLINLLDTPINEVITTYSNYFKDLNIDIPDNMFNNDYFYMLILGMKQNKLSPYSMHKILLDTVTINDVLDIFKYSDKYIMLLNDLLKSIKVMSSDIKYDDWALYDYKDIVKYDKIFDGVINICNDDKSIGLFNLLISKK